MQVFIFDIEADNFYQQCTKIHCIALARLGIDEEPLLFDNTNLHEGLEILSQADTLIGHNIINYDIPVLEKLYPDYKFTHNVIDTMNLSCIRYPLMHNHSLETFGKLYGFEKTNPLTGLNYTDEEWKQRKKIKNEAWNVYTKEMGAYCKQDVRITQLLLWNLDVQSLDRFTIDLSNNFAWIISQQIRTGCLIDKENLERLNEQILKDEVEAKAELDKMLPSFTDYEFKIYKRNNQNKNIKAGDIEVQEVITPFNLNSTQHWIRYLAEKYNYTPPKVRRKGKDEPTTCLDDEVLEKLDYPEIKHLLRYKTATKIRGMIYSNPNSIYNLLDENNVIHGSVMTEGTKSGRCSHNNPNLATMPGVRTNDNGIIYGLDGKYAHEVRSLFIARPGFKFIGFDAKALEICCLAHYLNNKEFIQEVEFGDIHTWTQNTTGLKTRKQAKTYMYAQLYGAGLQKLVENLSDSEKKYTQEDVKKFIKNFDEKLPELQLLKNHLEQQFTELDGIIGLDGRLLYTQNSYSLLNLLLQSTGAVIMKYCLVKLNEQLIKRGLKVGIDYNFLLNVHDEVQAEVRLGLEDVYKECVDEAVALTNKDLKLNCRLQIDLKIGDTWAECH